MPIGETAGFRRIRGGYQRGFSPKVMFVRPLHKNARQLLAGAHLDSHYYRNGVCHKLYSGEDFKIFIDYFSAIEDPRRARGQRYRFETLLAIAAAETLRPRLSGNRRVGAGTVRYGSQVFQGRQAPRQSAVPQCLLHSQCAGADRP